MTTQTPAPNASPATGVGPFTILSFPHPQGCRSYLVAEPESGEALALDVHLDLVRDVAERVRREGWRLRYVVDSHTHADHPSGSAALAAELGAERVAHAAAGHAGVERHPADGESLPLGSEAVTVRHAPGHTPDHLVLLAGGALFSGDTLLIGGVARTDFLGGDAGALYDTLQRLLGELPDDVVLYPGHDYEGRGHSTLGAERTANPWLGMERDEFVRQLTANPPPRPANMDALLELNREGAAVPETLSASEAAARVRAGGAASVIDVRTGGEFAGEHVPGSRSVPLDQLSARADDVRRAPAPRLLLCRTGSRAAMARETLAELGVGALTVVEGGLEAYRGAGGATEAGAGGVMSLERQVRIGAGSLVVVGCALGWLVHPGFTALAAFVGAGLVFAGVTDWCGMGLLLAKAPWNRRASSAAGDAESGGTCAAQAPPTSSEAPPAACAAAPPTKD